MQNHCMIICGQTATGKSSLAIEYALTRGGEIISADSRQVYRGLDIGSNKVTPREMRGVVHHMLDIVNPGDRFTVAEYQKRAREIILDCFSRGVTPILCGGTGLYIDATIYSHYIFEGNNAPLLPDTMTTEWIGLTSPREILLPRINDRAIAHLSGVSAEIQHLLEGGVSRDWLHHLGLEYRYGIDLLEGVISEKEYLDILTTKTWQYARRQMIWFKRNKEILWRDTTTAALE